MSDTGLIGDSLRQAREAADLTQQELADELHVTRETIQNWENERSVPGGNWSGRTPSEPLSERS